MSEVKFTAWVGKDVKFESLKSIGRLWSEAQPYEGLEWHWHHLQWPPYQIEITISTFISDGITEGSK